MGFALEMIVYLLISTMMSVSIMLGYADGKNDAYIQTAVTEAMLKAPPYGYITPEIQADVKTFLQETRGMDPAQITIEGTTSVYERKAKGSPDKIELRVKYPRKTLIFMGGILTDEYKAKRTISSEYKER